ncbi:MAG: hypothetical protein JO122_01610 [Acetobacteraceae bacterium]|nr:hypothetical protein [Acetobacteraceae bacterium]
MALVGVALAAVAGTFAYFGGWFSPDPLTPARFKLGIHLPYGRRAAAICVLSRATKGRRQYDGTL